MNTLDDLLPDLRRLLPASLHGAYLDGYVRRRRTPMELLLSRSLPNTHVAASTFEDARAEIQALRMPQWVANRYLSEVEQALAVGQDTREVVGRAKAWMATGLVNGPRDEADFAAVLQLVRGRGAYYEGSGHRLAEGMTDEAVATRLWDAGFRAHMDLVEDGARLLRAAGYDVSTERQREAWDYKPPAVKATEPIDRFMAAYEPALYEALRKHPDEFSYTSAEVPDFLPRWRNTLLTKDFNHDGYAMRGACKRLGIKCTKKALLAFLRPGADAVPQVPAGAHETMAATIVPAAADAPAYTVHRPHLWASDSSASKIRLGDAVRNCLADAPASAEAVMRRRVEHIDADLRQRGLKLDYPGQVVAYVVEDTAQRMAVRGREACAACGTDMGESDCPRCSAQERALEVATSAPLGIRHLGPDASKDDLSRARFAGHDDGPTPMDRTDMDSRYPLGAVAPTQEPDVPDVISDVTERVVSDLRHAIRTTNNKRMRGVADDGGSMTPLRTKMLAAAQGMELGKWHNALIYDKAMARLPVLEHKAIVSLALGGKIRILEVWGAHPDTPHSSTHYRLAATVVDAGLPPPTATPRPTLPSPRSDVAKERHWRESTYRAEADVIADTFNEGAVWQAEAIRRGGTAHGDVVRLSIYQEQRGPEYVVAVATVHDGEVEIDWRDLGLTMAARNEISRRLRSATAAESSDAPSPLQDLIESTEKRALELGAKPARTRSIGRVTSDNPEERRLGEAVRDLRDRSDFDEAVTWLESAELNIPFDIGERTSELDAVDKIMSEMWASILDTSTIALGGVRGEGRGTERFFYVSPEMLFDAGSLPFLLHRAMDNPSGSTYGPATLKEVAVKIIDPGDDDTYSAKVIDRDKVLKNDSMVHTNERGAHFIRSLYRNMKLLRDDLERAPKALDDVRKLLYWTGAMLDTPRCQDATHSRALESFEAAKVLYDEVRQRVVSRATTSDEVARIKAPLRKAAVSAANLATECGEGQVDIFSAPRPPAAARQPAFAPPGFGLDPGTPWPTTRTPEPDAHKWTGMPKAAPVDRSIDSSDRRYHVVVVNERTGAKHIVSRPDEPLTHAEGVTFLSKMSAYPGRRNQLQEVDDSSENPEKSADTMREEFEEFERSAEQARAIFLPFPWVLPSRLANYSRAMRPGDPARFGDLPPLPAALVSKQIAALNKLPPDFLEALKRYMIEIVELSLEDVVRNGYGVWQSPAVLAEVGPANVKIVKMNRGSGGAITEIELNGSTHTLVRRKDGAILKFGAPPASAVRGNIYQSPAEIRSAITASGPASRR